jgi:hypothetical protein
MLHWLDRSGHASLRKVRFLFGACCSRIAEQGSQKPGRSGARYPKGRAGRVAGRNAWTDGDPIDDVYGFDEFDDPIALVDSQARFCLFWAAAASLRAVPGGNFAGAALIRDIFGPLPFRPVTIAPSLFSWRDGAIVKLAKAIYDERLLPKGALDPSRLVVLAAFLLAAGCTDASLLEHLRGNGPHIRGCWAVDLLLNKE